MATPGLIHVGNKTLQNANTGSSLMNIVIAKTKTFFGNGGGSSGGGQAPTTDPFIGSPSWTSTLPSELPLAYTNGFQYDVKTDTFIVNKAGVINEVKPDNTVLKSVDWSASLGTNSYSGVILGYQNETYFYVVNRTNNKLYRCNRDLTGMPVYMMDFVLGTHFDATWQGSGFFDGTYIYMLKMSGSAYGLMRTNATNGSTAFLSLTSPITDSGYRTWLALGIYGGKIVFTYSVYNDNTYPLVGVYEIGSLNPLRVLFNDGEKVKSYLPSGYTKDLCINGAILSSTGYETGHPNTDAYDGNSSTFWGSNENGLGVRLNAFIGYDFQVTPRHIRQILLTKHATGADPYTPLSISVQNSDDGAVWTDVKVFTLDTTLQTEILDLPPSAIARRWRILANDTLATGYTFRIREIEMYERNLTGWFVAGPMPVTEEMFLTHGMDNIDFINNDTISYLDNDAFGILVYAEPGHSGIPQYTITAVPHPHIAFPSGDIYLNSAEGVDSFTLTATESGAGVVRVIASNDSGITWNTWDTINDKWRTIATTDLVDVELNGMTIATLNQRVRAEWDAFITAGKIRFAYYFEQAVSTDIANTDKLVAQLDMRGAWTKAKDTDYEYSYAKNDVLTVKLFTDGDYKVNYNTGTASGGSGSILTVVDGGTF